MRLGIFSFALAELSVYIAWYLLIRRGFRHDARQDFFDTYFLIILFFLGLVGVMVDHNSRHALSAVRDFLLPFLLFYGLYWLRLRPEQVRRLAYVYLAVALFSCGIGLLQFFTGKLAFFSEPEMLEWQEYKVSLILGSIVGEWLQRDTYLPTGLFAHPNNFASYITIPLIVSVACGLLAQKDDVPRTTWGIAAVIMTLALLATFFRSGLVIVVLAIASMIVVQNYLRSGRWKVLGAMMVIALGVVAYLSFKLLSFDEFGTVSGRAEMMRQASTVIARHPFLSLTGGLNDEYHRLFDEPQEVHNWLLFSTLRFGFVSTLVLLGFYLRWLKRFWSGLLVASGSDRALLLGGGLGLFGTVFIFGMTTPLLDNVSVNLGLMFWFAICASLLIVPSRIEPEI